jgi:hypothetical protein
MNYSITYSQAVSNTYIIAIIKYKKCMFKSTD